MTDRQKARTAKEALWEKYRNPKDQWESIPKLNTPKAQARLVVYEHADGCFGGIPSFCYRCGSMGGEGGGLFEANTLDDLHRMFETEALKFFSKKLNGVGSDKQKTVQREMKAFFAPSLFPHIEYERKAQIACKGGCGMYCTEDKLYDGYCFSCNYSLKKKQSIEL